MPRLLTLCLVIALASACSSVTVEQYRDYQPTLQPELFFDGYLTAHGVIKNRGGARHQDFQCQHRCILGQRHWHTGGRFHL